jgi:hypothetical protein
MYGKKKINKYSYSSYSYRHNVHSRNMYHMYSLIVDGWIWIRTQNKNNRHNTLCYVVYKPVSLRAYAISTTQSPPPPRQLTQSYGYLSFLFLSLSSPCVAGRGFVFINLAGKGTGAEPY